MPAHVWRHSSWNFLSTRSPVWTLPGGGLPPIDAEAAVTLGDLIVEVNIELPILAGTGPWKVAAGRTATLAGENFHSYAILFAHFIGFNRVFGTRDVDFVGVELLMAPMERGGLAPLRQSLDEVTDLPSLGGGSVNLINQGDIANSFDHTMMGSIVALQLGFEGLDWSDYLTLATLIVDRYNVTYDHLQVALADMSVKNNVNLSVPIGGHLFPGAPQASRSANIPLVAGVLIDIPTIQIQGDALGTLAFTMTDSQTYLDLIDFSAPFPASGTIDIDAEAGVAYTGRTLINISGRTYLRLSNLVRSSGVAHDAYEQVTLVDVQYMYLIGYGVTVVNQARSAGVVVDEADYDVATIDIDDQDVTVITADMAIDDLTVDVNAANIDMTNRAVNGNFETGDDTGWTEGTGTLEVSGTDPTPHLGHYRGAVQGPSPATWGTVYQDFVTSPGDQYDYRFFYRNMKADSLFINSSFEDLLTGWSLGKRINVLPYTEEQDFAPDEAHVLAVRYQEPQNIIVNGSFEDSIDRNLLPYELYKGMQQDPYATWTVIDATLHETGFFIVELIPDADLPAVGTMFADVDVEPGTDYTVTFKYVNFEKPNLIANGNFYDFYEYEGPIEGWTSRNPSNGLIHIEVDETSRYTLSTATEYGKKYVTSVEHEYTGLMTYSIEFYADFATEVGEEYAFSFRSDTQNYTGPDFAPHTNISDIGYTLGTPADEDLYESLTFVGQSRNYTDYLTGGRLEYDDEFVLRGPITFIATTTTTRVVFTFTATCSLDHPQFNPAGAAIQDVRCVLTSAPDRSQFTVKLGTTAAPDALHDELVNDGFTDMTFSDRVLQYGLYANAEQNLAENEFSVTVTPTETPLRVTIETAYYRRPLAPYIQHIYVTETDAEGWRFIQNNAAIVLRQLARGTAYEDRLLNVLRGEVIFDQVFATEIGKTYDLTMLYSTIDHYVGSLVGTALLEREFSNLLYTLESSDGVHTYVSGETGQSHAARNTSPVMGGIQTRNPLGGPIEIFPGYTKYFPGLWTLPDQIHPPTGLGTWTGPSTGGVSPITSGGTTYSFDDGNPGGNTPIMVYLPFQRFTAQTTATRIRIETTSDIEHYVAPNWLPGRRTDTGTKPILSGASTWIDRVYCFTVDPDYPPLNPNYTVDSYRYQLIIDSLQWSGRPTLFTSPRYIFEMYQDATVTIGEPYTFHFHYLTGRDRVEAALDRPHRISDLMYCLGTPTDPEAYVPWTTLGQTNQYVDGAPTTPATIYLVRSPVKEFLASGTTVRVTLRAIGRTIVVTPGSSVPYDENGLTFPPFHVYLDAVNLTHGFGVNESSATVQFGTEAVPALYGEEVLPVTFNWTEVSGNFTPLDATSRVTLQSQYSIDPLASAFDDIEIFSVFSYTNQVGGQNPVDTARYVINTFLPVSIDEAAFVRARRQLAQWRFGAYLTNPGMSEQLLMELGRQCNSLIMRDAYGRYTWHVLDASREEVMAFTPEANIVRDTFARDSAPADVIFTSIYVYFATKTGGSTSKADFAGVTYATPTETSHPTNTGLVSRCAQAMAVYGREHRLDFYAYWIQDFATANLLLERLVDRRTGRPDHISWQSWLDALPVRIGHLVSVEHPTLPSGGGRMQAEIMETEFLPSSMFTRFTAKLLGVIAPAAPVAENIEVTVDLNGTTTIMLAQYVTVTAPAEFDDTVVDLDQSIQGYQAFFDADGGLVHGTFQFNGAGGVVFTPALAEFGELECEYQVFDTYGSASNVAIITVTVLNTIGAAVSTQGGGYFDNAVAVNNGQALHSEQVYAAAEFVRLAEETVEPEQTATPVRTAGSSLLLAPTAS